MTNGPGVDARTLLDRAHLQERAALARLISHIERQDDVYEALTEIIEPPCEPAHVIGITGAPGAGKSTLVNRLALEFAKQDERVAILLIDPSSPYTGGAILGDRMRLESLAGHTNVYVRSMANRGHLGGLAAATPRAIDLLESTGWTRIFVETVGVGQSEFDIAQLADTQVVVVNPGWGDVIQASKAGLMETASIFVINKADRDGVAETRLDLEQLVSNSPSQGWRPPVCETVASKGQGIEVLAAAIRAHVARLDTDLPTSQRLTQRLHRSLTLELQARVGSALDRWTSTPEYQDLLGDLLSGSISRRDAMQKFYADLDTPDD
jgi:LAO/AO transport system kinase